MSDAPVPAAQARRVRTGALVGLVCLAALTGILLPLRDHVSLASVILLYLVAVVITAIAGGLAVSLAAAVAANLLINFFFVPPYHTFRVASGDNVITLVVSISVAITVSVAMDLAARQRAAAARTGVEAALLARISAEPAAAGSTESLLTRVRQTLRMDAAALVETDESGKDHVVAQSGRSLTGQPVLTVPAAAGLKLVVEGPEIFAPDPRFLVRIAAASARVLQAERLAAEAAQARELAEIDRLRSALLAAVGHDLRTPLAGIKAGVSSLRDPDLQLGPGEQAELLATIEESADRMADLVENLLAMSRLQAGALSVDARPIALDEVVAAAMLHQPEPGASVTVDVSDDLPLAYADPGLLERVVANLIANAVHHCPPGTPILVTAAATEDTVELRVVDHGPGILPADRDRVFAPFQRLGDRTTTGGLGLGLAIARGFTEAMDGTLTASDTPGGGLTVTVGLPRAQPPAVGGGIDR
ncbi:ATP-binding protein [Hamadaea sp.]|uniref:sensor histidine kinase n=1 Tax=Hamadaea sp. TaxID=2024425 RepID=UPI0025B8BA4B|nr:ATP-binding protein [Hamadaea sp.]